MFNRQRSIAKGDLSFAAASGPSASVAPPTFANRTESGAARKRAMEREYWQANFKVRRFPGQIAAGLANFPDPDSESAADSGGESNSSRQMNVDEPLSSL
jgi:hypothetical protein